MTEQLNSVLSHLNSNCKEKQNVAENAIKVKSNVFENIKFLGNGDNKINPFSESNLSSIYMNSLQQQNKCIVGLTILNQSKELDSNQDALKRTTPGEANASLQDNKNANLPDFKTDFGISPQSVGVPGPFADPKKEEFKVEYNEFNFPLPFEELNTIKFNVGTHGMIQSAIDLAKSESVIEIPEGEYFEELSINKNIHLKGIGKVKIRGLGISDAIICLGSHVILENLNFSQDDSQGGGALTVANGVTQCIKCTFKSSSISSVQVTTGGHLDAQGCIMKKSDNPALFVSNESQAFCEECEFINSKTYGAMITDTSTVTFLKCKFYGNNASGVGAIGSASVIVRDCEIKDNKECGAEIKATGVVALQSTVISDHKSGYGLLANGNVRVTVFDCKFLDNDIGAIRVTDGASVVSKQSLYNNSKGNVLIISHSNSSIELENDTLTGDCVAAAASFDGGRLNIINTNFVNLSNAGVLAYDSGELVVHGAYAENVKGIAFQIRDNASAEISHASVIGFSDYAFEILSGVTGSLEESVAINGDGVGVIAKDVTAFSVRKCQFAGNKLCGASTVGDSGLTFEECSFVNNGVYGINVQGENSHPNISNCTIANNGEIGIYISDDASPKIADCIINEQPKVGLLASGGSPFVNNTKIERCGVNGISMCRQSNGVFENCSLTAINGIGAHIEQQGTKAQFVRCKFDGCGRGSGVVVSNGGSSSLSECTFTKWEKPHVDVRNGGIAVLNKCEAHGSASGVGLQVHDGGVLQLKDTRVHDEAKIGVMVGELGKCTIDGGSVDRCGGVGVVCLPRSSARVEGCAVENNGQTGIQVNASANAEVTKCTIRGHSAVGLVYSPLASVDNRDNTFEGNVTKDVLID